MIHSEIFRLALKFFFPFLFFPFLSSRESMNVAHAVRLYEASKYISTQTYPV